MLKKMTVISALMGALIFTVPAAQADQKATASVLDHHLKSFGGGDMDAILSDYTDQSVIIVPNGVLRGKDQIKGLFTALFAEFGKPGVEFKLKLSTVADDVAYIVWNANTQDNIYKFATDTFVIKNGKIAYQTVAFDVSPK